MEPLTPPSLLDVFDARSRVSRVMRPSPLMTHPLLAGEFGCRVHIKHENHNPTGAFKVRGGINLVGSLGDADRRRGVITASTGNHGQSIAFASQRLGVSCTICVPVGNNPEKNANMRAYGATLVEHGRDFDEARELCEQLATERGLRYIHSANEPLLIAGVGTYALEIFEDLPDVDVVFVPIGGGSGACGLVTVRSGIGSRARIIGVQAARADAFERSWRGPERVVGETCDTFAEGMATRVTFDLTFDILKRELDDIVVLTEEELAEGVRLALRTTHNLAEGAGAASLMAAWTRRHSLRDQNVVCVMSGGNIDAAKLKRVLAE